jgi:3'-phosphoadenosine 5'-phosphosulfate sulfotransferase (PAPS reductase)/FAD synthetase
LPQCQRLATFLGWPLVVVRRPQGGMLDRWEQRWRDNVNRYIKLECVTLISPWSSAALRFCTSELKVAQITRELGRRFRGKPIINVVGIRRAESTARASRPISQPNSRLLRKDGTQGIDWNPILDLSVEDVFLVHDQAGFQSHYAYVNNGNHRVSCSVCVLSSLHDLQASLKDARNYPAYRRAVTLELDSAFSFQPNRWLCEVRPDLLSERQRELIEETKERRVRRKEAEARIPKELKFVQGWPTCLPSPAECELLAEVRCTVATVMGVSVRFTTGAAVRARYQELLQQKANKLEVKKQCRN